MLFLQETHSTLKDEAWQKDEFSAQLFFLYNPITESKQIKTFEKLFSNIKLLNLDELPQIVCAMAF